MSEGALWTPEEPKVIVTSEMPKQGTPIGLRSATWRRESFVAEMIRQLEEHPRKFKNWDNLSHKEKFDTLSKAQYEAVVEQFRWCAEDFSYAARNYFWITDNDGRDTLLTLWESQYLILQKYYDLKSQGKAQKIYIVKGRQLGCSLLIEAMLAWRTMFFTNMEALVVSVDAPHAAYLFSLMLHIYDRMPWWLKPEKASREEKNGVWFDNPNAEKRGTDPGLNSKIYVQWSTQYSGVGQGRKLLAAHSSEITDWYQPTARSIIEGDLKHAVKDTPEAFWFVETTGKESGSYSHKLWRACEKLAEEAQLYPLFLPYFFETTRKRKTPDGWQPKKPELAMRERVKMEWVQCLNCLQYRSRAVFGRDRHGERCPSCKTGFLQLVMLSNEQMYWKEVQRRQAEENGRDAVIEATRELASSAEEAFLAGGVSVFPLECQEAVTATIMDPDKYPGVRVGYFDTRSLEKPRFHGIDGSHPHPDHDGKFYCYLPECNFDHTGDMDQFNVTIWEKPQEGAAYVIGVDVAEGLGQNYSVIFVNKLGTVGPDEQVAILRDNRIDTLPLAFFICLFGYYYNTAMLCIEYEGIGKSSADAVRLIYQYPNLYQWKHMDSTNIRSNKWHWYTKPDTRQKLWQTARYWIRAGSWVIRSKNFLAEMQTFQKDEEDSKSAGHAAGETDDELFAGMISLYCSHDSDADERGIVRPPIVETGPINPLYEMQCQNPECGNIFGAERPDTVFRCPRCFSCNLIGKRTESDAPPTADALFDQLEKGSQSSGAMDPQNFDSSFL